MGAYMYPIEIKEERQVVKYTQDINVTDKIMTVDFILQNVGKDETFEVWTDARDGYTANIFFTINKTRLETDEERRKRVQREKSYMIEYNKRHKSNTQ